MPPDATGGWWLGSVGVAGAAFFLAVLTTLTFTVPNLSPVDEFVSDYANSSWAALYATAILIHVVGNTAIAVALVHVRPPGIAATIGVALFATATAGMAVSGIFRTDPSGAPPSLSGLVHRTAVTASFLLELVAVLLLAMALRGRSAWRGYARLSFAIGGMAALSMRWLFVATRLDVLPGLAERAALLVFLGWELATGWRLRGADPSQRRGWEAADGH